MSSFKDLERPTLVFKVGFFLPNVTRCLSIPNFRLQGKYRNVASFYREGQILRHRLDLGTEPGHHLLFNAKLLRPHSKHLF